jgi:hypothetical protein
MISDKTNDGSYGVGAHPLVGPDPSSAMETPVTATSHATGVFAPDADSFAFLTPDALLTYCQDRLHGLDTQAHEIFATQQHMNDESQAIHQVVATLHDAASEAGAKDPATLSAIQHAFAEAIATAGPDRSLAAKLAEARDSFLAQRKGDTTAATKAAEDAVKKLEGIGSDLDSDAQMNMVQLQSVMSQRQAALQLCTNLIQSLGASSRAIAANVGK